MFHSILKFRQNLLSFQKELENQNKLELESTKKISISESTIDQAKT